MSTADKLNANRVTAWDNFRWNLSKSDCLEEEFPFPKILRAMHLKIQCRPSIWKPVVHVSGKPTQGRCEICSDGTMPNDNRSICLSCPPGYAGTTGRCAICPEVVSGESGMFPCLQKVVVSPVCCLEHGQGITYHIPW